MRVVEGFIPLGAKVKEMSGSAQGDMPDVPLDQALIDSVIEANSDDDPLFITLEVLNEGVSKNRKNYTREFILDVVKQINEKKVDAYMGHLTDDEMATKTPEAKSIWLGAVAKEVDGKMRLFAKAYILPHAKTLRSYLKTAKATGKKIAVSIEGMADRAIRNANGALDLFGFSLESINWARPGAEGVPTSGQFVLAREMRDNSKEGEVMDKIEVIKNLKVSEMQEHNPDLITELVKSETESKDKELKSAKVAVKEMADVRELLGLDEKAELPTAVREMIEDNLNAELDRELTVKVKNTEARKIIRGLAEPKLQFGVKVAEMVDEVLQTDEAKAIVREMIDKTPTITPRIEKPVGTQRSFTKIK